MAEVTLHRSYRIRINDHDLERAESWQHVAPLRTLYDACSRQFDEVGSKGPLGSILYLVRDTFNNSVYWTVLETVSYRDPDLKILESIPYIVEETSMEVRR
jgi:hypothetical protein